MPFDILPNCAQVGWGANAIRFDMVSRTGHLDGKHIGSQQVEVEAGAQRGCAGATGWIVRDVEQALHAVEADIGWPVVIADEPRTRAGRRGQH